MNSLRRVLISLFVLAVNLGGQTGTGDIQGTVKDASGALLPGAKVAIVHTQTSRQYTTTSTELGFYIFPSVQPGRFRCENV